MSFFDRFRPYPELKTGNINLKSGTSFHGVVWKVAGEFVVLRNSEMIMDMGKAARHPVDGEVVVKLADIDFIQVVN